MFFASGDAVDIAGGDDSSLSNCALDYELLASEMYLKTSKIK